MSRYSWRRKLPSVSIFARQAQVQKAELRGRSNWPSPELIAAYVSDHHGTARELHSYTAHHLTILKSDSATSTARFQRAMDALLAETSSRASRERLAKL